MRMEKLYVGAKQNDLITCTSTFKCFMLKTFEHVRSKSLIPSIGNGENTTICYYFFQKKFRLVDKHLAQTFYISSFQKQVLCVHQTYSQCKLQGYLASWRTAMFTDSVNYKEYSHKDPIILHYCKHCTKLHVQTFFIWSILYISAFETVI